MNPIAKHLWELNHKPEWNKSDLDTIISPYVLDKDNKPKRKYKRFLSNKHSYPTLKIAIAKIPKKLTQRYLMKQDDWDDWSTSEFKQSDQYYNQKTFGKPTQLPKGTNVLPLLWMYVIKDNGTKKALMVCNGSPKMRGLVTLANTYAGALEQIGARVFRATTAMMNYITIEADASNAFAEAPPPKAPLYGTINKPY